VYNTYHGDSRQLRVNTVNLRNYLDSAGLASKHDVMESVGYNNVSSGISGFKIDAQYVMYSLD